MSFHCFVCGKESVENTGCMQCKHATYCSKDCQKVDWEIGGHAELCFNPKEALLELELDLEEPFIEHEEEDQIKGEMILKQQDVGAAIDWLVENRFNAYVPISNYPHDHEELSSYIGMSLENHPHEITTQFALQTFGERVAYIEGLKDTWNNFWDKRKEKKQAKKDAKRSIYEGKVSSNQDKAAKNKKKLEELQNKKKPKFWQLWKRKEASNDKKKLASATMKVNKYENKAKSYEGKLKK
jgi:hypothetical protein